MAYTVLARKYRSQTFDDVIGQDPIARTLKNAIKTDRVSHAYLFTGTRGVGKTTMARILAKSLNCLAVDEPTTEPCCKCESCLAVNVGEDIDVIEIDGASNNRVDEIRELRENAIYRPARARFKIYIIDEVHMLSTGAFNALLKTLEEPPSHVKFIFATTEPHKVLATIQSRCQRFDFSSIAPAAIAGQLESVLKAEKIGYEDDLVLPLAKMANGSMRDALSLLDRLISTGAEPLGGALLEELLGCADSEKVWNLVAKIGQNDAAGTLGAIDDLLKSGTGEVQTVDSIIDCMRDLMVVKSAGADSELLILTARQKERAAELAEFFDIAALVYNISTLEKLRWSIKNSDTARTLLEASLLRFALSEHFMNVDQLLSQLKAAPSGAVKKKRLPVNSPVPPKTHPAEPSDLTSLSASLDSISDNWRGILNLIGERLGPATAATLNSATPVEFENSTLTLEFPPSAKMKKKMCAENGRVDQIQNLLSKLLSTPLTLSLELAQAPAQTKTQAKQTETFARKRNELISDPAVKTVLLGLDAKVIGIDEK
ncbi:MAG: DNA polymerase III subunit gamma/tau [Sedimentisphaerales bacterium]|nr:DNA polymerase III subunit gamma/tau [Sedimentisphaerales bacterium]